MKNFVEIKDLNLDQLREILLYSYNFKKERTDKNKGAKDKYKILNDKIVALLFKKPSTRTRFSFEVGVAQMGGQTITASSSDMQLSNFESMADTARVLSMYVDMIIIRTNNHFDIVDLINHSQIPIINGLSDKSHPCQVLSDIFTFEEIVGPIKGRKVVWLGDYNNVFNSYNQAAKKFDFDLIYSGPLEFIPHNSEEIKNFSHQLDPIKALYNADLIVTDTWYSMHHNEKERELRNDLMKKYRLTSKLLNFAKSKCLVFHCMPIYRNNEIMSDIVDNFFHIFLKQAENRLHVQKGIMKWCF